MHLGTPFLGLDRVRHPSHCPSHPFPLAAAAPRQEATSTTKASRTAARATGLERAMGLVRPAACPAARPAAPPRGCEALAFPADHCPRRTRARAPPAPLRPTLRTLLCRRRPPPGGGGPGGVVFQPPPENPKVSHRGGAGEGLDRDARGPNEIFPPPEGEDFSGGGRPRVASLSEAAPPHLGRLCEGRDHGSPFPQSK